MENHIWVQHCVKMMSLQQPCSIFFFFSILGWWIFDNFLGLFLKVKFCCQCLHIYIVFIITSLNYLWMCPTSHTKSYDVMANGYMEIKHQSSVQDELQIGRRTLILLFLSNQYYLVFKFVLTNPIYLWRKRQRNAVLFSVHQLIRNAVMVCQSEKGSQT